MDKYQINWNERTAQQIIRNRSPGGVSADKGGERLLPEERGHKVSEKPESIVLAHLASPGNCEDSFRETLSVGRLIPEADFTPLNGGSDRPLSRIVGWLDSLNA